MNAAPHKDQYGVMLQAEHEILSKALNGHQDAAQLVAEQSPDFWLSTETRDIAKCMSSLLSDCRPVDGCTVYAEGRRLGLPVSGERLGLISDVAVKNYVGDLDARVATLKEGHARLDLKRKAAILGDLAEQGDFSVAGSLLCDLANMDCIDAEPRLKPADVLNAPDPPKPVFLNGPIRGILAILAGISGVCKSFQTLIWAVTIATGKTLQTAFQPSEQGRVLLFGYEDNPSTLKWRLWQIGSAFGIQSEIEEAICGGHLKFYTDMAGPLFTFRDGVVQPTEVFGDVSRIIATEKPALVVFDPLSAVAAVADENSSAQIAPVAEALSGLAKRHDCAVMLVHHTGKAGADNPNQNSLRGSSALACRSRWIAQIVPTDDRDIVKLAVTKDSYHRAADTVVLRRNESGVPVEVAEARDLDDVVDVVAEWVARHPQTLTRGMVSRSQAAGKDFLSDIARLHTWADQKACLSAVNKALDQGRLFEQKISRHGARPALYLTVYEDCEND